MTSNQHILSTATLPDTAVAAFSAAGLQVEVRPFIHTRALTEEAAIAGIGDLALRQITAVFTSTNAVQAVISNLATVPDWRLYVISGATARLVTDYFGAAAIAGKAADGKTLADRIIAHQVPEIVFFCGNKRLDTLPQLLQEQGIVLQELTVYETILTPVAVAGNYAGVLFFSPSAAESFFSLNQLPESVPLFAIGATTAAALAMYGRNPVITAPEPSRASVAAMVIRYLKEQQTQ